MIEPKREVAHDATGKDAASEELELAIAKLREGLANPKIGKLPWRYGDLRIDGRVFPEGHIWSIDGKTFARSAVNALPLLLDEIDRLRDGIAPIPSVGEGELECRNQVLEKLYGDASQHAHMQELMASSLRIERDNTRKALAALEAACERLAALRSPGVYLHMLDDSGAGDAMQLLDEARLKARSILKQGGE